jgi:FRG domain
MSQTIQSLEGFTRKIRKIIPEVDEVLLFRGHSNRRKFKLLPSVMRKPKFQKAEDAILRELIASHPSEFVTDTSTLEQLARVQHYSLPTRLLDATWNPLVALYFAANEKPKVAGEVLVFRIKKDRVKFYDSDTVSCLANLAHLKRKEKNAIDFNLTGDDFQDQPPIARLLQFIRAEKSHFLPVIIPEDLKTVLCVKPKQNSRRIAVQNGAFLLFGLTGALDNTPVSGITVERLQINARKKAEIIAELDRMSINYSTMFPEIEKAAIYISKKL